ncbi:MoxR family ATPase [Calothrix sp. FACHB-1219]|uniref:AAA family ATPase n=1 Tax=unclassified Calothrix TaxID=2619626 RepID=UPI0016852F44|nr:MULTISPECIES: MoxR family ATPase [unclassified Calothrix]MBD2207627.1 MoxR family ATPase [Calothrix sp. FACHB-168]MBD2222228.1 MoxR family ATPase [Calothrix sp. FACHB-1219]
MDPISLEYTGKIHPPVGGEWNEQLQRKLYHYYPSEELKEAVNLAIRLNRPLLLEGEPGCGKSDLARAVFYEFSSQTKLGVKWNYRLWNIQSTSKAQDGFYSYDYIGRLQAAQLAKVDIQDENSNPADSENYLELGPLGYAFEERKFIDRRSIVLIDEIDKADRNFPNDLLLALEDQRFEIKDVRPRRYLGDIKKEQQEISQKIPPMIIVITSNQEKELPNAFLRRCLYHYIEFPDKEQLTQIIKARFKNPPEELVKAAIERFIDLRSEMEDNKDETAKKVSTSELIDWFTILNEYPDEKIIEKLNKKELPFVSTLLKSRQDRSEYGFYGE